MYASSSDSVWHNCVYERVRELVWLTSVIIILEAIVRRVRGEKWLVIMILIPASEKDSWWGHADKSSSTISTDGFLWKFAKSGSKTMQKFRWAPSSCTHLHKTGLHALPFLSSTTVASHPSSMSVLLAVPLPRFAEFFFRRSM